MMHLVARDCKVHVVRLWLWGFGLQAHVNGALGEEALSASSLKVLGANDDPAAEYRDCSVKLGCSPGFFGGGFE